MAPEHARYGGRGLVPALIGLAWLCLACACTMEPRYRAPALPVPDQWPIPATTAAASAPDAEPAAPDANLVATRDIGWRDFFVDTRL